MYVINQAQDGKINNSCTGCSSLKCTFGLFDPSFFNQTQVNFKKIKMPRSVFVVMMSYICSKSVYIFWDTPLSLTWYVFENTIITLCDTIILMTVLVLLSNTFRAKRQSKLFASFHGNDRELHSQSSQTHAFEMFLKFQVLCFSH